ncbi:MAG TPA: hypothetical protein PLY72_25300, partial [Candidatus Obscuribacter sp.]|nr:hypothetical protein [Candidatus Obscuribacter sp.]
SLSILEAAGGRAESQSALGHDILGALLRDQDKHAQAVGEGREAVAILDECLRKTDEKAPDYGRLRRAQANSCLQLGLSFNASANPEMALEYLHRALDLPADLDQGGRLRANIFAALAAAYLQLGEFKEAECAALSALDLVASPLGAEDELARARALAAAYAVILQAPGKSSDERLKAQAMLVEASALRKKWLRPGDPELRN